MTRLCVNWSLIAGVMNLDLSGLLSLLIAAEAMLPYYVKYVGLSQFGCVRGRGTLAANMLTRTLVDFGGNR